MFGQLIKYTLFYITALIHAVLFKSSHGTENILKMFQQASCEMAKQGPGEALAKHNFWKSELASLTGETPELTTSERTDSEIFDLAANICYHSGLWDESDIADYGDFEGAVQFSPKDNLGQVMELPGAESFVHHNSTHDFVHENEIDGGFEFRDAGDGDYPGGEGGPGVNDVITMAIQGGYGCWCRMGTDDILGGRGTPKDIIDEYCRDLNHSYKCIIEEYMEESNTICEPWESSYFVNMTKVFQGGVGVIDGECEDAMDSGFTTCTKKACMVETLFAFRYFSHYMEDSNFSWQYKMPSGNPVAGTFNPTVEECPLPTGGNPHLYCCGVYPYRTRHYTHDATVQCCGDERYDSSVEQCCNDPFYYGLHPDISVQPIATTCLTT